MFDLKTVEKDVRFASLGNARRIWAVSAIHGELDKLINLHDTIFPHIRVGDRVLYTGNYIGYGAQSCAVIDEILTFRRAVLAQPGIIPSDFIYLRGAQEEMWQKLLQLQFAPDPLNTLLWMLANGLNNTLYAYGLSPQDGIYACHQGMIGIAAWTKKVHTAVKSQKGHDILTAHLVRAAFTPHNNSQTPMLFVNAGIDAHKKLTDQGDSFWWASHKFDTILRPYDPFQKVIRGYDPNHNGLNFAPEKATIDGGCGFGGTLVCAVFNAHDGDILDMLKC